MDARGRAARPPPRERRAPGPHPGAQLSRSLPGFDSPDPALNHAVRWALGRVGGRLRVAPVGPSDPFDLDAVDDLLDDAHRWERVRDPGLLDPNELLERLVGGLFGARIDGAGYRLELRPHPPVSWRRFGLRRVRAHRTVFDLDVRPRAEWITVRLAITFGPSVAVDVSLPEAWEVSRVTVDEVPLEGCRAIFTAIAEHEVVLFTGRGPVR